MILFFMGTVHNTRGRSGGGTVTVEHFASISVLKREGASISAQNSKGTWIFHLFH